MVNTVATRMKKQKKKAHPRERETITIVDSDDVIEPSAPPKQPSRLTPISIPDSDKSEQVSNHREKRHRRAKPEVVITRRVSQRFSDDEVNDTSSPSGSNYEPDAPKDREDGRVNSSSDLMLSKGKGKATEQSGGGNLRRKRSRVVSKTFVSSSEDEVPLTKKPRTISRADATEFLAVQQDDTVPPTIQLHDAATSITDPSEDLAGPSADGGPWVNPPQAASTMFMQDSVDMQVPPPTETHDHPPIDIQVPSPNPPVLDVSSVLPTHHANASSTPAPTTTSHQTNAPSAPTPTTTPHQTNTPSALAPTTASSNPGTAAQESLFRDPPQSAPTRPKPRQYIKKVTEAKQNEDDAFSLRNRVRAAVPDNDSPSILLLAAEEGRPPSEVVDDGPGLPLPSATIVTPSSRPSEEPQDRQKELHIRQQQVCDPYFPRQSRHFERDPYAPHAPQFPSPQGFTDHVVGSGMPIAGHHQQNGRGTYNEPFPAYMGGGGWYRPVGSDPHLQAYPGPFPGVFGQYRPPFPDADGPRELQPPAFNHPPAGYDRHPFYFHGHPNPWQFHPVPQRSPHPNRPPLPNVDARAGPSNHPDASVGKVDGQPGHHNLSGGFASGQ